MAEITLNDVYEYMREKNPGVGVVYNDAVALWNCLDEAGRERLKQKIQK